MTPRAVSLPVTPALTLECKFWLEDDSWVGIAEGVPITIAARSFADAKKIMEERLASYSKTCYEAGPPQEANR
jgi:hypothetical protein